MSTGRFRISLVPDRKTLLAAVGDVNDVRIWSGIPYHLLLAARPAGVIDAGLAMEPDAPLRALRRNLWNLGRVLRGCGHGGYTFSDAFLRRLWRRNRVALAGQRVVNCIQLYPRELIEDTRIEKWFFIDQTMRHYLEDYGLAAAISPANLEDIYRREREGYAAAAGIVCHSRWAAEGVIAEHGVPRHKVHVVVPGANLDPLAYEAWARNRAAPQPDPRAPLRLVFVGKAPLRKGLDRLIRALVMARRAGADCTLRVIGCAPESLPEPLRAVEGVEWRGFIHKQQHAREYLDAVAGCDVGCLLSRAEAGGMCLREFHALGLAVIAPDVGGSPDHCIRNASCMVAPDARDEEIAALLTRLCGDRAAVRAMPVSWSGRTGVGWPSAVAALAGIMAARPGIPDPPKKGIR